ncbi:hypothetical protein CSUB01_09193 [Colletotrichum sublineola]|uniref:Uncharacterized protein n=1 Tax=Colletotrichum sublineola TaxID=1173701 RepID=A0A066X1S1_COLSU|nr:hypothetical protein CSUB01_09193 [Colletotrichum sublineola]
MAILTQSCAGDVSHSVLQDPSARPRWRVDRDPLKFGVEVAGQSLGLAEGTRKPLPIENGLLAVNHELALDPIMDEPVRLASWDIHGIRLLPVSYEFLLISAYDCNGAVHGQHSSTVRPNAYSWQQFMYNSL